MKRIFALIILVVVGVSGYAAADDLGFIQGTWPKSWPPELEPLRKQSRSWAASNADYKQDSRMHLIAFTDREQFESAWPHILKVKSKGAPIVLGLPLKRKRPADYKGGATQRRQTADEIEFIESTRVVIHCPLNRPDALAAFPGKPHLEVNEEDTLGRWQDTYVISLQVDGKIVDLNRISLPPDTPIHDIRFKGDGPKP